MGFKPIISNRTISIDHEIENRLDSVASSIPIK
ncbi:hypothetical protein PSYPI_34595, partial [Pseudomonas syringae pv. pisi str. 1704B]